MAEQGIVSVRFTKNMAEEDGFMMKSNSDKQIGMGVLLGFLILSACGQTPPATQSTPIPFVDNATSTPSLIPTKTFLPAATTTTSVTPLLTIPTSTPTFDASTIVTATSALTKTCPQSNSEAKLDTMPFYEHRDKYFDDQIFNDILEYLNTGGSWDIVNLELSNSEKYGRSLGSINNLDLTNDGTNEFVLEIWPSFGIYSCRNGFYELLLNMNGAVDEPASIVEIKDMNMNGIPDVVAGITVCSGHCFDFSIFEWNGQEFQSLLDEWELISSSDKEVVDINQDGVFELVIIGPFPSMGSYIDYIPMREQKDIYMWDGTKFNLSRPTFSPPEYRFQAIQDADMEVLDGFFEKALMLYRNVIFSEELNWWSKDRREHEVKVYLDIWDPAKPTPPPEPPEDKTEYHRLAAYAYYRIILLHIAQGKESEAITTYNNLQEKIGNDPYGHPYAEMATAFLEAYQSTHKMYDGCAAAIQYAAEHLEILIPLGSDYHGAQSHTYVPADVCPFR